MSKGQRASVILAQGSGGAATLNLISDFFLKKFDNPWLKAMHDGAIITIGDNRIAFTTDSYVVSPIFFPDSDIGELAVNGTVNDLAMCGAKPLYISAGIILEEGFPLDDLDKITDSMQSAVEKSGVKLVTGDTKVVQRGKGDGIYINTSGIGLVYPGINISTDNISEGDVILINGNLGDHGLAILSKREGFDFESSIVSDCAALNVMTEEIIQSTQEIRFLRDPTRGGLAATLNEIAQSSKYEIEIEEESLPISEAVKAACSILGLDPLQIANEGKLIVISGQKSADKLLEVMKGNPLGKKSAIIGRVGKKGGARVVMKTIIGTRRLIDMPVGEQLPRIC